MTKVTFCVLRYVIPLTKLSILVAVLNRQILMPLCPTNDGFLGDASFQQQHLRLGWWCSTNKDSMKTKVQLFLWVYLTVNTMWVRQGNTNEVSSYFRTMFRSFRFQNFGSLRAKSWYPLIPNIWVILELNSSLQNHLNIDLPRSLIKAWLVAMESLMAFDLF